MAPQYSPIFIQHQPCQHSRRYFYLLNLPQNRVIRGAHLPKKVEYIDAEHEFFKTPERFQEQIEASLDSTRKEHPAKKDDSLKKVIFNKFHIIKDPSNSSSLQIAR